MSPISKCNCLRGQTVWKALGPPLRVSETEPLRSAPDTLSSRHAQATSPEQPPVTEAWHASKTLLPLPPPTLSLPKPGGQTLPFQGLNPWRSFSHSCSFNAGPSPLPLDGYGRALRIPTARLSHPRRRHLSKTQSRCRGPENEALGNREASVPLAIWPPHSTWTAQRPCRAPVTPARPRAASGRKWLSAPSLHTNSCAQRWLLCDRPSAQPGSTLVQAGLSSSVYLNFQVRPATPTLLGSNHPRQQQGPPGGDRQRC